MAKKVFMVEKKMFTGKNKMNLELKNSNKKCLVWSVHIRLYAAEMWTTNDGTEG